MLWYSIVLPCPSFVTLRQSITHGAAGGIPSRVAVDRSAENSSKPQPVGASTRVLTEAAVGFTNTIARAPTPGRVPFANSNMYVRSVLSTYSV